MSKDKEQKRDPENLRHPHIVGAAHTFVGGKEYCDLTIRLDPLDLDGALSIFPLAEGVGLDHLHESHWRAHELARQESEAIAELAKRRADEAAKLAAAAPVVAPMAAPLPTETPPAEASTPAVTPEAKSETPKL